MTGTTTPAAQRLRTASLAELVTISLPEADRGLLISEKQPLIRAFREAIRACDVPTLEAVYEGNEALHRNIPSSANARVARESAFTSGLRALAGLGLAITVDGLDRARACLRRAEKWLDASRLCLPAAVAAAGPAEAAAVARLLRRSGLRPAERAAQLLEPETLRDPVRLTAWIWLLDLADRLPARKPGPHCGVLFDRGADGGVAKLSFSTLPALPPLLAPDPATLLLCSVDRSFQQMLTDVWMITALHPATVLWSVDQPREQTVRITGPSLGVAFAVLHRDLRRWALLRHIADRDRTMIVGAIDSTGQVLSVRGYPSKLGKINARDRIILPRSDHVEVKEITAAANVRPVLHPVRTVSGASFLSRLPGWRRVASTLITVALLAAATGGAAAVYQSVARGRTVADLGRSEISNAAKALQDRATQVRAADPVGALRLSTAAVALDDTPAVRANLIDLLTSTRYRGTLLPDENAAYVSGLQLNTDGTVMLASAENGAQIWTSEGARAWTPHTIPSGGVLSPDGTLVAAPEGDGHRLIDVTDPAKPRPAAMVPAASPVTFSPDSRSLIAGTYPPTVWSLTDPEQPERIGPAGNPEDGDRSAGAIAMCGTTTVAVGHLGATRLYRLRDSAAAELLAETDGNPNREIGVLVCTDELLVAADLGQIGVGDLDSSVTVWEIDEPVKPVRYATLGAQQGIATGLALHDRTLAVTGDSGTRIGFLPYSEAGEGRFEDVAMVAGIGSVAFGSGDDMLFTGRLDRGPGISLWDITDVSDADLISNNDAAFAWSTSLAGDLLAASGSAPSRIGEEQGPEVTLLRATADGRLARLSSLKLPPGGTDSYYPEVALSPDRQLLAASLPGGARLWHLDEHGRPTRAGDVANSAPFTALSFTHDPRVLIGIDQRGNASVWDLTDPARPRAAGTLTGPGNGTEAAWSSLSAAVGAPVMATASTDGSRVVLWRTDDPLAPVPASTIVLPPLPTSTALTPREFEPLIELAPNGRRLITTEGTSSRLKLWELHDLTKPAGMSLPEQVAGHDVAFGPTGNLLGTLGGEMATAHLWDLTDARHPVQLRRVISGPQGHSQVSNVQFGEAMFYVGETMRGLPVAEQARMSVNPRAYACGIVGHGPNRSEWAAVLPGREWQEACP